MSSIYTTDNDGTDRTGQEIACRVAYMIDNDQPVLCTLIGDQPLFYADDVELDNEEEALLEEESQSDLLFRLTHQDLQEKARQLKEKKQAFVDANKLDVFAAFDQNFASLKKPETSNTANVLKDILGNSRLGASLLSFAQSKAIEIVQSEEVSEAIYDRDQGKIFIPFGLEEGTAIIGLAQELRRAWQHKKGVLINPLTFSPDDAIIINRAQVADLCVTKVRIAWELSLDGYNAAWQAIAASGLNDIAYTFVREARQDFRNLNNGWAMQISFEKWFLSDRCKLEDRRIIQTMLADHGGHIFESNAAAQQISIDIVTRLGDMPFGKNYLSGFASSIIMDPLYTEVRDRSSANFLWFIKFESSFRDKERDLKKSEKSDITKPRIRTTLFDTSEEETYEEEGFGAVLAFPQARAVRTRTSRKGGSRSGDVIALFNEHDAE